jgi:hypothetical protein
MCWVFTIKVQYKMFFDNLINIKTNKSFWKRDHVNQNTEIDLML